MIKRIWHDLFGHTGKEPYYWYDPEAQTYLLLSETCKDCGARTHYTLPGDAGERFHIWVLQQRIHDRVMTKTKPEVIEAITKALQR